MRTIFLSAFLIFSSLPVLGKVGIIVNSDLYPSIATTLDAYIADLAMFEGKTVWVNGISFDETSSITTLRDTLRSHYNTDNLEGALLIGALPITMYEMENWRNEHSEFPTDLYYMDLDGSWLDNALDGSWGRTGYFDDHQDGSGDRQVEIWVSRITASATPGLGNEVAIVNNYFNRASNRMKGKDLVAGRSLTLGSSLDWGAEKGDLMTVDLGYSSNLHIAYNNPFDSSTIWQRELRSGYEYASIFEHSGPDGNGTNAAIGGPSFMNTDYLAMGTTGGVSNARFYNMFACSNSRFTTTDCMGAIYALGHNGLISMGTTKSGSMNEYQYYNAHLAAGDCFGEAFKAWLNDFAITMSTDPNQIMEHIYWYYGMVMFGAGTLQKTPYAADIEAPANLTAFSINTTNIQLQWIDNSSNEDGFRIECATGSGAFAEVATTGANTTSYVNSGRVPGTKYRYRVRAYNSTLTSLYSNVDSATTFTNDALSGVATASSQMSGYGAANVKDNSTTSRWVASSSTMPQWVTIDLGSFKSITGFEIVFPYAGTSGDAYDFVITTSADNSTWTTLLDCDPNASTATEQQYYNYKATARYVRITIYDAPGTRNASINEFRILCSAEPPTPAWVSSIEIYYNQTELTWTAALGATSYTVKRSTQPGGPYTWWETGIAGTSYKTTNLEPDHNYFFIVCGVNDAGEGDPSAELAVNGHWSLPPAPQNVTIAPVENDYGYILNWVDAALDDQRCEVERATLGLSDWVVIGGHNRDTNWYVDNTVDNTGTDYYQYRVAAIGINGGRSYSSVVTSQVPPCAPSNLIATVMSPSEVQLDWTDNSTNEWGFHIERQTSPSEEWDYVSWVVYATYTDFALAGGKTYSYRIHSFNAFGDSRYSNVVTVTTPNESPVAPYNCVATAASPSQINLSWSESSWNEFGFYIEQAPSASGPFTQIASVDANITSYQNTGLLSNTTYWYRVRAFNDAGNSDYSNTASATTPPSMPAPSNLGASTVSSSQINLWWTDNSTGETGFYIERAISASGPWTQIGSTGANVVNYTSTGLNPNTTYWYRVRAYNSLGSSNYSNTASATTQDVPPTAPSNLTATAISSVQINLAWTDNANNETGFYVERGTGASGPWSQIAVLGANVTTYSNTGLSGGTTYWYRIRAYNNLGISGYSNSASATTPNAPPAAPSNLTASANSSSQITIVWNDNSTNETGFYIERASASAGPFTQIASVGANVTNYVNTGLTAGTTYWYRVRAYSTYGNSDYSNTASATTQPGAPNAPTALVATANSRTQITLAWTDNASNETGFYIERAPSGGSFSQIASVGANVVTYVNTGLTAGTAYQYRVRAYNGSGNSAYSNTASATTHANLALSGTPSSSSQQTGNETAKANDNNTGTRWAASSSTMPQWWKIDLGSSKTLSEVEIMFERTGTTGDCNDFKVETSPDNSTWTMRVDRQTNTNTAQTQAYTFSATARYVRITINDAPGTYWASMYEFRTFGQ